MTAPSVPAAPSRRGSPVRRFIRSAAWGLLAPLLVIAGLVFVASRTMTLQWVAEQAVSLTGGRLQIEGIAGSFLSEVTADSLRWRDARGTITVTAPRFTYHPLALLDGLIRVERVSAADIQVELPPVVTNGPPREPIRLPQALAALLPVAVERIDARRVVVRRGGAELIRLRNLEAVVRHEGDRFTLSLLNADVTAGHGDGGGMVGTVGMRGETAVLSRAPYATDGRLLLQLPIGAQPLRVDVRINGPLEELSVRATTALAGAPVELRSILYPLDPRPWRHLRLDLKDFDLSRHDPALPVTRLSGSYEAEVMPAWANESKPLLIGPLNLANSIAGPLDQGFFPVASAKAVVGYVGGRLEARELQVNGPMGEIAGQGSIGPDGLRLGLAGEKLLLQGIASTLAPRVLAARIAIEPTAAAPGVVAGVGRTPGWFAGAATLGVRALDLEVTAADSMLFARMKGLLTQGRLQISDAEVQSKSDRPGRSGQAAFRGSVGLARPWPMDLSGNFREFDPGQLATMPPAVLNGTWRLAGLASAADGGSFEAEVTLANSRLRGLPLAGRFAASLSVDRGGPRRLRDVDADFHWGSGVVEAAGALGELGDTLHLSLDLPKVGELDAGLNGLLTAQGDLRGALRSPAFEGTVQARNLVAPAGELVTTIAAAALQVRSHQVQTGVFEVQARLDGVDVAPLTSGGASAAATGVLRFDQVTAAIDGSADAHEADLTAIGSDRRITVSAKGGLGGDGQWRGVVREFAAWHPLLKMPAATVVAAGGEGGRAGEQLRLRQPFALNVGAGRAGARGASFDFQGAVLNLKQADWRDPILTVSADATGLAAGWLGRFMNLKKIEPRGDAAEDPPHQEKAVGDLRLAATVDFIGSLADVSAAGWRGRVELQRESGDLFIAPPGIAQSEAAGAIAAGLRSMQASVSLNALDLQAVVNVDGENIGQIAGEARAVLQGGARPVWSQASLASTPLSGQVELATNSFRWISPLAGGNWLVDGALSARLQLAGTLQRPRVDGFISGNNLTAGEDALGMRLSNGVLAAELDGGRVDVRLLRFESGEGSVAISGLLQPHAYGNSQARVVIDRLPFALSADERVVLSGSAGATLGQAGLSVSGHLALDEAAIVLGDRSEALASSDPTIRMGRGAPATDHVHDHFPDPVAASPVPRAGTSAGEFGSHGRRAGLGTARTPVGTGAGAGAQDFSIVTDMQVDLGRRFHVSGSGLDGHLRGTIRLLGSFPESPFATGEVGLVGATYLVLGRKLRLRQGRLLFNGPMDDPGLDIVAIREHPGFESGIALGGSASLPAVRLISDPEVADEEKLAWLVLGTGLQDARGAGQLLVLEAAATNLFGAIDPVLGPVHAREESRVDLQSLRGEGDAIGATAGAIAGGPDRAHGTVAALGTRLSSRLSATCEQSLRAMWDILRLQYEITDRLSSSAQLGGARVADLLGSSPVD